MAALPLPIKVLRFVEGEGLLRGGERVVVALSGGPDSVALLHVLLELRGALGLEVFAAHLDHMIRGEESYRDYLFVVDLCYELGVPLHAERMPVPDLVGKGESLEECARRVRYGFFERAMARFGADLLATAHHRDDQAETVLHHVLRGTGLEGLRGILPRRDRFIRPLLCASRAEIMGYLEAKGLPFVLDSTNEDPSYTRNRIRKELLPYLERAFNPSVKEALWRLSQLARMHGEIVEELVEAERTRLFREGDRFALVRSDLYGLARKALRLEALRRTCESVLGRSQSFERLTFADGLILRGEGVAELSGGFLYGGKVALLSAEEVKPPSPVRLGLDQLKAGVRFCWLWWDLGLKLELSSPGATAEGEGLSIPLEGAQVEVSPLKEGERLPVRPGREEGASEVLRRRGVPPWMRRVLPVVRVEGRPAFVPFLGLLAGGPRCKEGGAVLNLSMADRRGITSLLEGF